MVKAGEQEERLDDVVHPAPRCFEGTSCVFERQSDLILHPPRRAFPLLVARTAGNKDDVADDSALHKRRLVLGGMRGGVPDVPPLHHHTHPPVTSSFE